MAANTTIGDLTITFTGKVGTDGTMTSTIDVDPLNATGSFSAKKGAAAAKPRRKHKIKGWHDASPFLASQED